MVDLFMEVEGFMADTGNIGNGRFFSGIDAAGVVDLMSEDLFWGRLEYPGGFWQLQDDLEAGLYARYTDELLHDDCRTFKLNGKRFYDAMDRLAAVLQRDFNLRMHLNFNKNLSPLVGLMDDSCGGMCVCTIGVGDLKAREPVSDMYFMTAALNLLHIHRHFLMRYTGYTVSSTEYTCEIQEALAVSDLAIQGNERYVRRNYNTYPIEIEAERNATMMAGGYLLKYGLKTADFLSILVLAERFKAQRFDYFVSDRVFDDFDLSDFQGVSDCYMALLNVFSAALDNSFHCRRNYNPVEDAHDEALKLLDNQDWVELAELFFAEKDGGMKDRKMCSLVTHLHPDLCPDFE